MPPLSVKYTMITATRMLAIGALLLAMMAGCTGGGELEPLRADIRSQPPQTHISSSTETAPATTSLPAISPTKPRPPQNGQLVEPTIPAPEPAVTPEPTDSFPVPPERDPYRLARELIPVEDSPSPTLAVGTRRSFELVDLENLERYSSEFELRLVTPNAYWFVEDGVYIRQGDLEQSASEFEDTIYPKVTGAFGAEWKPGVDGDPHLYVLNASLKLVGGYYNPADEYPREIRPVSNEIEAIYINARYIPIGSAIYGTVLAHELQHAIHWNADPTEESWVNEGLSELAVTIAGYPETSMLDFRYAGPTSLIIWPAETAGGAENYGSASLFMHYLTEHYGGRSNLRPLLSEQPDGIEGVDAYLQSAGYDVRFTDIFRDWAVANLLDEDTGIYGYGEIDIPFPVNRSIQTNGKLESSIPQFSTEYVRLNVPDSPATLSFESDADVPLLPVEAGNGCWWSNNGDAIDSTLTAHADLRNVQQATLNYQIWYAIEENWDYAYLEVSTDGGKRWRILETAYTSSSNPLSSSFGPGYTGSSDRWLKESVSLNQWAGQEILLRFQYTTDAALYNHGLCLRDLRVSGYGGKDAPVEWRPNGFVWTDNLVKQDFVVQVIYEGREDADNRVLQLNLNSANRGEMTLERDTDARRVVVAVQPMASPSRMPANYTLSLARAE